MADPRTRVLAKVLSKMADVMADAAAELEKLAEPSRFVSPRPPGPPPSVPRRSRPRS